MSVFSCYFHYGNQTQRIYGFSLIFGFSILAWPSLMASSSTWCTWYYGNSKPRQLNKVRNKFDYWMLANKTASLIFPNSWQSKYGKAEISVFLNMNTLKSSMKMLFGFLLCEVNFKTDRQIKNRKQNYSMWMLSI